MDGSLPGSRDQPGPGTAGTAGAARGARGCAQRKLQGCTGSGWAGKPAQRGLGQQILLSKKTLRPSTAHQPWANSCPQPRQAGADSIVRAPAAPGAPAQFPAHSRMVITHNHRAIANSSAKNILHTLLQGQVLGKHVLCLRLSPFTR